MTSWSPIERFRAERKQIMQDGDLARDQAFRIRQSGDDNTAKLESPYWRQCSKALARYRELLPEIAISRSPFTNQIITWGMDVVDLDGWFWERRNPIRAQIGKDRTFRAVTGAMRLREPVTWTDFRVKPGPAIPFVLPHILDQPGVTAVITQLPIGPHTGWPITYFSEKKPVGELVNDWGGNQYHAYDDNGDWLGWHDADPIIEEYDFDLTGWIASEKLQWITPGDPNMTLRKGLDNCPYVDIEGPPKIAIIENGEVRYFGLEDYS